MVTDRTWLSNLVHTLLARRDTPELCGAGMPSEEALEADPHRACGAAREVALLAAVLARALHAILAASRSGSLMTRTPRARHSRPRRASGSGRRSRRNGASRGGASPGRSR